MLKTTAIWEAGGGIRRWFICINPRARWFLGAIFAVATTTACGARSGLYDFVGVDAGPTLSPSNSMDAPPATPKCDWVTTEPQQEIVLADDLEYPRGLWVKGCRIYFTNTSAPDSTDGKRTLEMYDLSTRKRSVLLSHPTNAMFVAVDSREMIYLVGQDVSNGITLTSISVVDPTSLVESHVVNIGKGDDVGGDPWEADPFGFAASASDDLFVGVRRTAIWGTLFMPPRIYRLPSGSYGAPTVFADDTGGQCIAEHGGAVYDVTGPSGRADSGWLVRYAGVGSSTDVCPLSSQAMALSAKWLYSMDSSGLWRESANTCSGIEVLTNSMYPSVGLSVRFDSALDALVYSSAAHHGTDGYKGGAVRILTRVE